MKHYLTFFGIILFSVSTYGQNVNTIYTTDIDNFWQAYDSIRITKDTTKQLRFVQTLYLDKASDGLQNFIKLLNNKNGIYVIINNNPSPPPSGAGYSGHVDLILNGKCISGAYTTPRAGVKSIRIWVLE